jgi:hypothetical protein
MLQLGEEIPGHLEEWLLVGVTSAVAPLLVILEMAVAFIPPEPARLVIEPGLIPGLTIGKDVSAPLKIAHLNAPNQLSAELR